MYFEINIKLKVNTNCIKKIKMTLWFKLLEVH